MEERRLNQLLTALLGSQDLVDKWWLSPNNAFGGKSPAEMWGYSEYGKKAVVQYVHRHFNGDYS